MKSHVPLPVRLCELYTRYLQGVNPHDVPMTDDYLRFARVDLVHIRLEAVYTLINATAMHCQHVSNNSGYKT